MDIREVVSRGKPANRHLAYVPDITEKRRIVETLVGMSNAEGGTVVVGADVEERGPTAFTDVPTRQEFAIESEEELLRGVDSTLECRIDRFRIGGSRFISFTVPPSDRIRRIRDEAVDKPVFPTHSRTELEYLSGSDIDYFLELSSPGFC